MARSNPMNLLFINNPMQLSPPDNPMESSSMIGNWMHGSTSAAHNDKHVYPLKHSKRHPLTSRSGSRAPLLSMDTLLQSLSNQSMSYVRRDSASSFATTCSTSSSASFSATGSSAPSSARPSPGPPIHRHSPVTPSSQMDHPPVLPPCSRKHKYGTIYAHAPAAQPYPPTILGRVHKVRKDYAWEFKSKNISARYRNPKAQRESESRDAHRLILSKLEQQSITLNPNIAEEARGGWKELKANNTNLNTDPSVPPLSHNKAHVLRTTYNKGTDFIALFDIITSTLRTLGLEEIAAQLALCVEKAGCQDSEAERNRFQDLNNSLSG